MVCPTGALVDISHIEKVQSAINNQAKMAVAMISPGFAASVAEYFSLRNSENTLGLITSALKKMGFSKVYDMSFAYDFNIYLDAFQLIDRVSKKNPLPLLSSCCPAWVEYCEEFQTAMLNDLSKYKSPQQLMGRLIKHTLHNSEIDNVYTVSFMPCVANKSEASWEVNTQKGVSETDAVITVREFLRMLRSYGLNISQLSSENPEEPFLNNSAAGIQASYSGGKAEAVAHQINLMINGINAPDLKFTVPKNPGSRKEVKVRIGKNEYGFAWVSGIAEVQKYLDYLTMEGRKDIHYIEAMACTGGCAGGGGQPVSMNTERAKQRKKIAQDMEKLKLNEVAGQNSSLLSVTRFIPGSEESATYFTRFQERDVR
jgi:iron only hydrogenase large subunit-like protein